jgi:hypothetical protein
MRDEPISIAAPALHKKIRGRKSIFLDIHYWIKLAREKDQTAIKIKNLLHALVEGGMIFCPLSKDVLDELFKQEHESSRRVAELMDRLSLNVCFANSNEIYSKELLNHLVAVVDDKKYEIEDTDLFVPVMAFLSSHAELAFPDSFPDDNIKTLSKFLTDKLSQMTVVELVDLLKSKLPLRIETDLSGYSRTWKERRDLAKGNRSSMRRVEEEHIARTVILPRLNKLRGMLPLSIQEKYLRYVRSLPKDRYDGTLGSILKDLPSINNLIDVMTVAGLDVNLKPRINHYHDMEMMIVPLTYSNVFVSEDKWIRHLLGQLNGTTHRKRAVYLDSFDRLETFLKSFEK